MQLLKTLFDRREDGAWEISALKGLALRPDGEGAGDFYAIKDDIVLFHSTYAGTIKSVMGQSIVPIVSNVPGENILKCVGTGFFVSCSGLLITAAHVITDPIDRKYGNVSELDDLTWHARQLSFGVMVPTNPIFQAPAFRFFPFEWAAFLAERRSSPLPFRNVDLKIATDIAICKVAPTDGDEPHQPLAVLQPRMVGGGMAVGATAHAVGYAGMSEVELIRAQNGAIVGDYRFRLHVSHGAITERFPENMETKAALTPGPCFSFAATIPPGMSGSPIFDREGIYVHGVVSTGWKDEHGMEKFGYGSMLGPSMRLPIPQMKSASLAELQASSTEGMPKFSGPGI